MICNKNTLTSDEKFYNDVETLLGNPASAKLSRHYQRVNDKMGKIFVFGGFLNRSQITTTMEVFNRSVAVLILSFSIKYLKNILIALFLICLYGKTDMQRRDLQGLKGLTAASGYYSTIDQKITNNIRKTQTWEGSEELSTTNTPPSIYSTSLTAVSSDNKIYIAGRSYLSFSCLYLIQISYMKNILYSMWPAKQSPLPVPHAVLPYYRTTR